MKLAMSVTESESSGLTNAYTSVLSACGSLAIKGASRWLEAALNVGARPSNRLSAKATSETNRTTRRCFRASGMRLFLSVETHFGLASKRTTIHERSVAQGIGPPFSQASGIRREHTLLTRGERFCISHSSHSQKIRIL